MRSPAPRSCPCSVVDITLASEARNPSSNLGRGAFLDAIRQYGLLAFALPEDHSFFLRTG